jgi:hypothetical protein
MATTDVLALIKELETLDAREKSVVDALVQHGAELERQGQESHAVTVEDLAKVAEGLRSLATLIDDVQARIGEAQPAPASPAASTNGASPPAQQHAPRTFRITTPPMGGDDVKAFQRVLNGRFEAWAINRHIDEDGEYGPQTRRAAREAAYGLGLAAGDCEHGITPVVRRVIRTPSIRTEKQLARARARRAWLAKRRAALADPKPAAPAAPAAPAEPAPHAAPATPPAHAAPAKDRHEVAAAIRAAHGRYEDIIVREAHHSGVPVSLVCAVIEHETHFRNVFGHDRVANPIKSPARGLLEVTEERYHEYLRHRRLGQGSQGVGPMQLTFPGFQDRADQLGGCWQPGPNIRVGVEVLADHIKRLGLRKGVQAYNGAPGDDYATAVLNLQGIWHDRFGHVHAAAPAQRDGAKPAPETIHRGAKSDAARTLQAATKRRLSKRHLEDLARSVDEDGVVGAKTMAAVTTAAWVLGAQRSTLNKMNGSGEIPVGIQRMICNPGRRTDEQKALGKKRVAHMLAQRKQRATAAAKAGTARTRVVLLAQQAAANYRRNPGAYHYLAGGTANTEFLKPTPRNWRSDCSQFVASVYKAAGLPSPANVAHEWASTYSMVKKGRITAHPRPGDLGMYGTHGAPHHVELYCGEPGQEFIGHGSPPIDSRTPGRPDYYLTYDFLH